MSPPRVRCAGRLLAVLLGVVCGATGGSVPAAPVATPARVTPSEPSCSAPPRTTLADPPPVVVLVTLDTTRRDRLGAYATRTDRAGNALPSLTPHLDALAARGLVFEEARTTNPITLPAHASMLTGTYPTAHGVRDNGIFRVADESVLLAEALAEHGVRTGAAVGALVLDARYGLAQGFEHYGTPPVRRLGQPLRGADRPADEVVDDALGWLDGVPADEPVFLWVHLFDAHFPWEPPEPHRAATTSLYDGEVAFCDAQVGRLLAAVDARGPARRLTLVVADHGEGLGDHGEAAHGVFVYDTTMHVPLLVEAAGVGAARLTAPVSVTDVAPTVLGWFGVPADAMPDARAPSLLDTAATELAARAAGSPAARGASGTAATALPAALADRPLPLDSLLPWHEHGWHPVRGLVWRGLKLVIGARPELYDLRADPDERVDLAAERPERVAVLRARLADLDAEHPPLDWHRRAVPDTATVHVLRSLGYAGAGDGSPPPPGADLPDARDRLPDLARRDEALFLMWKGRRMLGIDGLLAETPRAPHGSAEAARHAAGRRDLADAHALLATLLAASPDDPELLLYQGVVALALGDAAEAVGLFRRVVVHRPRAADAHFDLAAALEQTGDDAGALAAMRRALELEPRALRASLWMADRHEARDEPHHAAWWLERLLGDAPVADDEPDEEVRAVATRLAELRRRAAARGLEVGPPE